MHNCCLSASKLAVFSMTWTLQTMNHYVCMTFGDSSCYANRSKRGHPIAGIVQGNGTGPQIWAAVSSPLFEIMWMDRFLATIQCAMSLHYKDIVWFCLC